MTTKHPHSHSRSRPPSNVAERTVYIVNKSAHDFSPAKEFGTLVFLSEGRMPRYQANNMYRQFYPVLAKSSPQDYILPCGLSVMNMLATSIFAHLHGRLNLLLFRKGKYFEVNLVFNPPSPTPPNTKEP